jgi:HD-like signal output (HDOD) protein
VPDAAATLVKRLNTLKTIPNVAVQLTKMIADDTYTMPEFENVIKMDPTLVLKILKTVNSPYYALLSKVTNVAEAVSFIGMENLRNLIVLDILKNIVKNSEDHVHFSKSRLWLHSAAVGVCCQLIAERIFAQNSEDAFLSGLLHDIGMIVENQLQPSLFLEACGRFSLGKRSIIVCELDAVGTDHARVGFLLAKDWKLPACVCEAVQQHHVQLKKMAPDSVSGILQMAEYLVCRQNYPPLIGMTGLLSPQLITHMHDNIMEYKAIMLDLPAELEKARELYSLDTEQGGDA